MLYSYDLVLPANTPKASPVWLDISLAPGVIHRVSVGIPAGTMSLAHVKIFRFEHQVWPSNPDEDLTWDNFVLEWDDYLPLEEEPYALKAMGWNTDTKYTHTISLRFGVVPMAVYWKTGPTEELSRLLQEAFGLV